MRYDRLSIPGQTCWSYSAAEMFGWAALTYTSNWGIGGLFSEVVQGDGGVRLDPGKAIVGIVDHYLVVFKRECGVLAILLDRMGVVFGGHVGSKWGGAVLGDPLDRASRTTLLTVI